MHDVTQVEFFMLSLTGLNSVFLLLDWLAFQGQRTQSAQAGERISGFMPFPSVFALCELQRALSWIWTRVAMFISNDDNQYTLGTSFFKYVQRLAEKFMASRICVCLLFWCSNIVVLGKNFL